MYMIVIFMLNNPTGLMSVEYINKYIEITKK